MTSPPKLATATCGPLRIKKIIIKLKAEVNARWHGSEKSIARDLGLVYLHVINTQTRRARSNRQFSRSSSQHYLIS